MSALTDAQGAIGDEVTFMSRLDSTLSQHGISRSKLAISAGICPTQLSRWMTERTVPCMESKLLLLHHLDVVIYG